MLALTLWPEWAHAVAFLGKRIENRDWPPPDTLIGQRLAIHAGAAIGGRRGRPAAREAAVALRGGALVAGVELVVHVDGTELAVGIAGDSTRAVETGMVLCTAIVAGRLKRSPERGYRPWGVEAAEWWWGLEDVQRLPIPVPCRGAQGLWTVPDHVLERMGVAHA